MATTKAKSAASKAAKLAKDRGIEQTGTALQTLPSTALKGMPEGFKAMRALQLPTLVMKTPGEGRVLMFLSGLRVSTVAPKKKEEFNATVATVVDTTTGEQMIFLVPAVVEGVFVDTFSSVREKPAKGDYDARQALYDAMPLTTKTFYIENNGQREGRRHVDFTVIEGESAKVSPAGEA